LNCLHLFSFIYLNNRQNYCKIDGTEKKQFKLKELDISTIELTFEFTYKGFQDSEGDIVTLDGFESDQIYTLYFKPNNLSISAKIPSISFYFSSYTLLLLLL
jgi:hypothetical protein